MLENKIKILGAFGGKSTNKNNTCLQVNKNILIDAGNILKGLDEEASYIDHIFLTHSHLDHIVDIPFLIDAFFEKREKPITIYALKETIEHLKKYIFNWNIWPDFCEINLMGQENSAIVFKEIEVNETIEFDDCTIKAIKTQHTTSSCGYVITKNDHAILFTSDTYKCQNIWDELNQNKAIKSLIIEISFPSRLSEIAKASKHLTPDNLKDELEKLQRDDVAIYINHIKPSYEEEIKEELLKLNILNGGKVLSDGDTIDIKHHTVKPTLFLECQIKDHVDQLIEIGDSLTNEKDLNILMEKILLGAKNLSNADGGTLYLLTDEKELSFTVVQTDSLNIKMGGTQGEITWPNLNLYNENGEANTKMVAALCALKNELFNIEDVYHAKDFNFEGTKKFDKSTGYRTKSMLVIPMVNYENEVIGVIQLLNKLDSSKNIISFTKEDENLIRSMSSQAAISIENARLIENLENLLNAFIKSVVKAMGEKSIYTGGHINRVAYIATMMANEINEDNTIFKDINYNKNELKQIDLAAWLHDIGKITTPEHVIDKATKLQTIVDRVDLVKTRIEVAKRDLKIEYLRNKDQLTDEHLKEFETSIRTQLKEFDEDLAFIEEINHGTFMTAEMEDRVKKIASKKVCINDKLTPILNEDEVYNLCIQKGTLNNEEREIINNHVVVTYNMLNALPFPKKLQRVPLMAGSHHKKVGGGGYGAKEIMDMPMTLEDKILAVADVFEALTANDRPYKQANSLNKSMHILASMVKYEELDKELVQFFVEKNLHLKYAKEFLNQEQMDEITVDFEKL